MHSHAIGIDFGTSKTLVSHINPQTGHPETIRLGRGGDLIPTTIFIDSDGRFSFGDDADDMIEDISGTYLRGFKMQLGSDTPVHMYLAPNGDFRQLTAKDLVGEYLLYIRQQVKKLVYQGEPVTRATITRPVNFSPAQCQELQQAALAAGFEHVEFTTEPEAAGLAYCRLNAAHAFARNALVVDWGGGTLDFALVTRSHDSVRTHGHLTDGDMEMGGEKFDEILWNYAVESLKSHGVTTLNPVSQLPRVRRSKELLSSRQEVALRLSHENGACPPLELSRETFNSMIAAYIDKAAQKLHGLLSRIPAEHQPEMLLLVGGSSQIPLIKETLEEACGLPAYMWHYSREAVALGAALWNHVEQKPAAPKTESKADRIKLISSGNNKIAVINTLRDIYPQLGLADAKQLVESAPVILPDKTEMNPCVAAGMLERAGCKVKILSKAEEYEPEQHESLYNNISGVWEGSCTNLSAGGITAPIMLVLDTKAQKITGNLVIGGTELVGSGKITGQIIGNSITFQSPGDNIHFSQITWRGTASNNVIEGTYVVEPKNIFIKPQHGLFRTSKQERQKGTKSGRLKLLSFGNNKIAVIKTLRDIYPHLGLADAKQLVESAPVILPDKTEMNPCVAAGMLERTGCKVKILSKDEEYEGEQKDTQFDNESGTNEGSCTNHPAAQAPTHIPQPTHEPAAPPKSGGSSDDSGCWKIVFIIIAIVLMCACG